MKIVAIASIAALLLPPSLGAAPAELRDSALRVFDNNKDAIVWLSVVAKTSVSVDGDAPPQIKAQLAGQDRETTAEALGTFITPDGLLVASLAQVDQASVVNGRTVNTPMGAVTIKSEAQIKEIRAIMPDGQEIPADLVLKDPDLGLAFIRLRMESEEAQGAEIHSVDLGDTAEGSMLDDCIVVARLTDSFNREPSASTSEISGIIKHPRTFYRVAATFTGCPVFLGNGKLLGMLMLHKPGGESADGQVKLSPVVLPAADIAKVAEQAKEAKPEVKEQAAEENQEEEAGKNEEEGAPEEEPAE